MSKTTEGVMVNSTLKRRAVLAFVPVAVLAGAGGTYAATQSGGPEQERQAFLNDAASRLHVSSGTLSSALQGAFIDRIEAAVKAGRLSRSQADDIEKHIRQGGGPPPFGGPGPLGMHGLGAHGFAGPGPGPRGGGLESAARYLGLTDQQLAKELTGGKSLAQVASAQHKSVDGLKQAIKDAITRRLDAAVSAKQLTAADQKAILARLDSHLDALVNRTGPPSGPDGPRGGTPGLPPGGPESGPPRDQGGPPGPPPF